ncbi:MAG: GYD domain-containing protein [Methanospirillum sp.]
MLFIGLVKFKKALGAGIAAENLKDIEADERAGIRVLGVYWTLGQYDNVVLFEVPDEKAAMQMALKRRDRMEIETLVAVPADPSSPSGPA